MCFLMGFLVQSKKTKLLLYDTEVITYSLSRASNNIYTGCPGILVQSNKLF